MRQPLIAVAVAFFGLITAAPGAAQSATDCSPQGQNAYVHRVMDEIYLWYREMPPVDTFALHSPEAVLEALRVRDRDAHFSFIAGKAADQAFYGESQFVGFGFSSRVTGPDELRVAQVFPDSPASEGGLTRGAFIVEINGRAVPDLLATGEINTVFGPSEPGVRGSVRYRDLAGNERTAELTKRVVTMPPVSVVTVHTVDGRRVGYVAFRNFVTPSVAALDVAFAELTREGVTELVLDLRYNGGGLVSVAQHLSGLIGGRRTAGQPLTKFVHNDKNSHRNSTISFPTQPRALDLSRLVVITTRASASASELVVNGLRPFMPVTVVGDTTYGKPVGQYGFEFCAKVLYPVAFATRNAADAGDYFGGIPADCPATDDLDHELGDASEASLAEALRYIGTGSCSASAAGSARAAALRRPALAREPHRENGWQQLLGAY